MWGLLFRVADGRVETSVPGWLLNAAATYTMIAHVERIVAELATDPGGYGYDPGSTYTIFTQTWDRATANIPSLAFGRDISGHEAVGLVPDAYYLDSWGFRELRGEGGARAWADRKPIIAWRGSVTGSGDFHAAADIPRIRLARACRDISSTDVALIGVHPTMDARLFTDETRALMTEQGLWGESWPFSKFAEHRFAIDIDGHGNAWGLLEKLILGCCVLKVGTPYEQWYYDRLRPWIHYVPVREDLSDLAQQVDWCLAHQDQCEWIAHNGMALAGTLRFEDELPRSCETFIRIAAPARPSSWRPTPSIVSPKPVTFEAARDWERQGLLDLAIEDYARLGGGGPDAAEALSRKAALHKERGEAAQAMADLLRAETIAPGDPMLKLQLAQISTSMGRDITAVRYLQAGLGSAPHLAELRVNLADVCGRLGWLDVAYWAVHDLPEQLPDWWAHARQRAVTQYEAERAQARAALRTRDRTGTVSHGDAWTLAHRFFATGRLGLARRLCEQLIAATPDAFPPHDLLSKIVARQSGPAAAVAFLRSLSPDLRASPDYPARVARCLLEEGRFDEMRLELAGTAVAKETFDGLFLTMVALAYLGDRESLRAHCRIWMERSPKEVLPAGVLVTAQPIRAEAEAPPAEAEDALEIVQFWDRREVPDDVRAVLESWSLHHPRARRTLFDAEAAMAFLSEAFGHEVAAAFDLCHHAAMKADYFRIAYLYKVGGIYADADERCLRPMVSILATAAKSQLSAVRSGDVFGYLHNFFLGARAGSRPLELALEEATRSILDASARGERLAIWEATGPGLITRSAGRFLAEQESGASSDLLLLPMRQFRSYVTTAGDLRYKLDGAANWQLA